MLDSIEVIDVVIEFVGYLFAPKKIVVTEFGIEVVVIVLFTKPSKSRRLISGAELDRRLRHRYRIRGLSFSPRKIVVTEFGIEIDVIRFVPEYRHITSLYS